MDYYNFLAKAPGSLVVGGERTRFNAGETLRLEGSKGKLVVEEKASGYQYLVLISIEKADKETSDEAQEVKEPEVEAVDEPEIKTSEETPAPASELLSKDASRTEVKLFLQKAEQDGTATKELVEEIMKMFPEFKSVQLEGNRILDLLTM